MKENTLNIVVVGLLVLVLGLAGFLIARPVIEVERVKVVEVSAVGAQSGQAQYWPVEFFDTVTIGPNGTAFNQFNCDTASWNPDALSSSTAPQLDIANAGAALGDACIASFSSPTSTLEWVAVCSVTSAGTSTISLATLGDSVTNLTSATARVCTFQF